MGRIPRSGHEKNKFQELVLCSSDGRDGTYEERNDVPVALQERLEDAAAAVKATTTAMRNKNNLTVPDEMREMAVEPAKCRDPVRRKSRWFTGQRSRNSDEPARTEMSGQKKSETFVKSGQKGDVRGASRENLFPKKSWR